MLFTYKTNNCIPKQVATYLLSLSLAQTCFSCGSQYVQNIKPSYLAGAGATSIASIGGMPIAAPNKVSTPFPLAHSTDLTPIMNETTALPLPMENSTLNLDISTDAFLKKIHLPTECPRVYYHDSFHINVDGKEYYTKKTVTFATLFGVTGVPAILFGAARFLCNHKLYNWPWRSTTPRRSHYYTCLGRICCCGPKD